MELKIESKKCSGCRTCQLVCALANFSEVNPSKAALEVEGRFPAPGDYNVRLCDQCGDCEEICPVDAIYRENGVYKIDREECTGCLRCLEVCDREVIYKHEAEEAPIKCIICGECVEICPRDVFELKD